MNKTIKLSAIALATLLTASVLQAQTAIKPSDSNSENLIITKKDSTKERITIVIDGNNITVNGKPVDDFENDDVDIVQQKVKDGNAFMYGTMPPIAPVPPRVRIFKDDMARSIKSNKAFLGVMTEKNEQGAKITDVTEGSAAEKAGLKENDIITKIGDDKITSPDDVYKAIGKRKPEENVAITYVRDGKQTSANITLGKSDQMRVFSWNAPGKDFNYDFENNFKRNFLLGWGDKPRLGISVQDTEEGNGVKVLELDDEDSPAAKAGLKEDDVITQVNGKAITSTEDLRESIKDLKKGDTVKITYKRNNQTQTVDVKLPKDLKTMDL